MDVGSTADLGRQDVEVPRPVGLADELAHVLGRHPRVLGHPHRGRRAAVAVEVEAVEGSTLLIAIALPYSPQPGERGEGVGGGGGRGGGGGGGGGERREKIRGGEVASGEFRM